MNKQEKVLTGILILIVIGLILWQSFYWLRDKYHETGFIEGQESIYFKIIDELQRHGYTTLTITQNNQTQIIRLGVLPS